jgi:putative acetyltransferase
LGKLNEKPLAKQKKCNTMFYIGNYMKLICIEQKYGNKYLLDNLLKTWGSSVKDTHLFLSENDIKDLMPKVMEEIKNIKKLLVIVNEDSMYCAFMNIKR